MLDCCKVVDLEVLLLCLVHSFVVLINLQIDGFLSLMEIINFQLLFVCCVNIVPFSTLY